jgi:uncharacterized protein (TIGR02569 family)
MLNDVSPRPPARSVIAAFGLAGHRPVRMSDGVWRVDRLVLRPAPAELEWVRWEERVLGALADVGFRMQRPRRADDGRITVDGWIARDFLPGTDAGPAWSAILDVGRRLGAALGSVPSGVGLPLPPPRSDAWAAADRMAWDDEPIREDLRDTVVAALLALRRRMSAPSQIVHGDLTRNVLLHPSLPPAVIDFSPYWRPVEVSLAVVVADAVTWHDAPLALADDIGSTPMGAQALVRAMLGRHLTARQLGRGLLTGPARDRFDALLRRAGELVAAAD